MTIRKFIGEWNKDLKWQGARTRQYKNDVTETWMIGKAEGAENFAFRYYQLQAGGKSNLEQHGYDHGVFVLHGSGEVLLGADVHDISQGDILHIAPDVTHQLRNTGQDVLGFLCVIPARRKKLGKTVWAEEGIDFNQ
jgi:quercetin dioxygenase-like cupin family protein